MNISIWTVAELVEDIIKENPKDLPKLLNELAKSEKAEDYGKVVNRVVEYFALKEQFEKAKDHREELKELAKEQVIAIIEPTRITLLGNTYPKRELIKSLGYYWNPNLKVWEKSMGWGEKILNWHVNLQEIQQVTDKIFIG